MHVIGADLSYVNEVEDDGGIFYAGGSQGDPFRILKESGANIVRVRLWHTPTWTQYSDLADVQRTTRRAKALGMAVLLDFHYSDTWADPAKQIIPAAWAQLPDIDTLANAVYDYTFDVLLELDRGDLMPDFVQVGNEINTEILMPDAYDGLAIRWQRNAPLINAGLRAVRAAGQATSAHPRAMLHIAQPENILPWFDAALAAGISDFDAIGLSYYPKWSITSVDQCGEVIRTARERYDKDVMIVETAYPWTLDIGRSQSHLMGPEAVLPAYSASPQGQRQFLVDLTRAVNNAGGIGVIYWEPAWISTAQTLSIWENATLFDYAGAALESIEFLRCADCAQDDINPI